jgi:hypothetical protein
MSGPFVCTCASADDLGMDDASVGTDGQVRLDERNLVREWPALTELVADYWRYQRLSGRAREADDMAAWVCVHDLVGVPAWDRVIDLIDELLTQAADAGEVGLVAAGPLEELVLPAEQGPPVHCGCRGSRS